MGAGQVGEEVGPGGKGQGQSGPQVGLVGGGDWVSVGGAMRGRRQAWWEGKG